MSTIAEWSGSITPQEALAQMLEAFASMSGGRYGWGIYEADGAAEAMAENLAKGSGPCHMVWLPDHPATVIGPDPDRPEHAVTMLVTGNGPSSKSNAHGIIKILTVLHALSKAPADAPTDYDRLRAERDAMAGAAKKLADKLDAITEHPEYQAVWTSYHVHGGRYSGPQWVDELNTLRTALETRP